MKILSTAILVLVAAVAAYALDDTISNDYWNTTGYVNVLTSTAAAATTAAFDSRVEGSRASAAVLKFDTRPIGTIVILH